MSVEFGGELAGSRIANLREGSLDVLHGDHGRRATASRRGRHIARLAM